MNLRRVGAASIVVVMLVVSSLGWAASAGAYVPAHAGKTFHHNPGWRERGAWPRRPGWLRRAVLVLNRRSGHDLLRTGRWRASRPQPPRHIFTSATQGRQGRWSFPLNPRPMVHRAAAQRLTGPGSAISSRIRMGTTSTSTMPSSRAGAVRGQLGR